MKKTFVLDTNVLIHDPSSVFNFEENDIVLPITVIEELDNLKRGQGEISYSSRHALRTIDQLRSSGKLSEGVPLEKGGTLKVMVEDASDQCLDNLGFSECTADDRIIAVALNLQKSTRQPVVIVSKDTAVRIKAESLGLVAQDYTTDKTSLFQKYGKVLIEDEYGNGIRSVHYSVTNGRLTRQWGDDGSKALPKKINLMGFTAKNIEQECALDALLADEVDVVALTGKAGTGKTLLALLAGIFLVEKSMPAASGKQKKTDDGRGFEQVVVARPIIPMGGDIGYIPGDIEEKLRPWMQPIYDNLDVIVSTPKDYMKDNKLSSKYRSSHYLIDTGMVHIEPLTYIRGRSLPHRYFIIDEGQNLRPLDVKTIITRCGVGTKIVFTGDLDQIDTPYLDAHSNGLAYLISRFINEPNFCYLNLTSSVRSNLAERAAELL